VVYGLRLPRMKKRVPGFISNTVMAVLLVGIAAVAAEESNPAVDAIFADLTKPGSPGCALGIYRDSKIIYTKGYGLANVEENVPITPEAVFDIASVSKQFTAASILLLERQGKLRLDDDIRKYIPELPNYSSTGGQKITILQLLNHTSGLRDYGVLYSLAGIDNDDVIGDEDALQFVVRQRELNFPPGSDWQYSNSGYYLLSLVVRRVSGKSLKDFADENIFRPLGMSHTQIRNDHTSLIPHRVLAYDTGENGRYKLSVPYAEETGGGMVHTSLDDLQKWDANFYSGQVGGANFAAEMEERGKLNDGRTVEYAKGLRVWKLRGLQAVSHSGGSGGYRSYVVRFPEQHFSIACLCNLGNVNRRMRVGAVAELYLGQLMKSKPATFTGSLAAQELHALVATYRNPTTAEVWRVTLHDTKLRVDFEGFPVELRALSPTEFEPVDYLFEIRLKFQPGTEKCATRKLTVTREMELPATFEAIQGTKPSVAELMTYSGDYWSEELRATYRLAVKDGKLQMKDLVGADGITHATVPFDELRPLLADEFDLKGAPIVIDFKRDGERRITGFTMNAFQERGIVFIREATK
jgi:CubicO group peptidase (beta-lactamase class C family)